MKIQEFNAFALDVTTSILWQYNNATNLVSLIQKKQNWYGFFQSGFWGVWYDTVFNIQGVSIFGAAIWSILLDVPFYITDEPFVASPVWGFNAYDTSFPTLENDNENYENGNFSPFNQNLNLTLEQQRFLLRLRYFQLSTLTNIAGINTLENYSINTFLNYLCTDNDIGYTGTIYVIDNLNMSITYHFTEPSFPSALFNALRELDIFPRPAGVAVTFTGL